MYVKTPAQVRGIPAARCAVSAGLTDQGAPQIMQVISALDAHGFPTVVASVRMSADETRVHIAALVKALAESECLAKGTL
jgi:hypothetical protein